MASKKELLLKLPPNAPVQFQGSKDPAHGGRVLFSRARNLEDKEDVWIVRTHMGQSGIIIEIPKQILPELQSEAPIFCMGTANDEGQAAEPGQLSTYRIKASYVKVLELK